MIELKKYTAIAVVGALTDLALNKYLTSRQPTGEISKALKGFYSNINPIKSALVASVTFVAVVLIADVLVNNLSKNGK
jgi:hypothetical protein